MSNFEEFAKDTQKQAILDEIQKMKEERGADFNWQSYFVNFKGYLPHGVNYGKYVEEKDKTKKFGETEKTLAEYIADVEASIKESCVDFEAAFSLGELATEKYRDLFKLVKAGKGESEQAKQLEQEQKKLHSKFYETIVPIYVALRSKGYRHLDIVS